MMECRELSSHKKRLPVLTFETSKGSCSEKKNSIPI